MKRLVAILLTLLMVVSLAACGGASTQNPTTATEKVDVKDVKIDNYKKTFSGMQKYLLDLKLISGDNKIETQADLIGAKKGVRYNVDKTNFVEFYAFDIQATPDEAVKVYDCIANDKEYNVLGLEDLEGVVSKSGKYIMLYPASSTYDYSKIEKEFKKF